jgi:Fatty acid hydroxylase superfamily
MSSLLQPDVVFAFHRAVEAAGALFVSHGLAVGLLMYLDLSGRWTPYRLCKNRPDHTVAGYLHGWKSFCVDLLCLFVPCMMACIWHSAGAIFSDQNQDTHVQAVTKFVSGYVLGKVWAFVIHYILHFPSLYRFHRRHHQKPANLVASAAWDDSWIEYAIMELPSFCLALLCFPTHWWVHLAHFVLHGIDGACGHSGFQAPGLLGWIFDGEYHYYHHAYLTVNYAELEVIDKLFGTHHSQQTRFAKKVV